MRAAIAAGAIALSFACAHGKEDRTICPEYRAQRCLAGQECAMDKDRGCKVCHCEGVVKTGPDGNPTLPDPGR
jgi:hypothetical protein